MSRPYGVLTNILRDAGDRTDTDLRSLDRERAPWEWRVQATCECLSWRGALDNLERRHTEDRLGESIYSEAPVHTRSALVVAQSLMAKGIITEDELQSKMNEVRARMATG